MRHAERQWGSDIHVRSAPQMREYVAAADRIAATRPRSLLDWGCGIGHMSHLLRERGVRVTSVEYAPTAAAGERHRQQHYPGVEILFTDDPVALPFSDGNFDAVLSMGVLEHVSNPDDSLEELHRVLSHGGRLWVFKLPNRWSYLEWIARRLGMPHHGDRPDDRLYTLASARRLLGRHSFEVVSARHANLLPLTLPGAAATRTAPWIWRTNVLLARVPLLRSLATNVELVAVRA